MSIFTRVKANIPNSITCLNLLSGACACVFAFHYQEVFGPLSGYQWAFVLMAASAVFDLLMEPWPVGCTYIHCSARNSTRYPDLISFGLAPALLMFNTVEYFHGGWTWWAFCSMVTVLFGALRLARFNIDDRQTTYLSVFRFRPMLFSGSVLWHGIMPICILGICLRR